MSSNKIEQTDLSDAEKQDKLEELNMYKEMYKNPVTKFAITLVEILPVGILLSLIYSLIFWLIGRKQG